jgi:DNA (cytosine-5)-methyltransferase 1
MSWLFSQVLVEEYLGENCSDGELVCAVEWEQYPASVLCARQNDGLLARFPIWDDVQTFDGTSWRGLVDVISGGFPCQDISAAGKGAGIEGERSSMWKHMARIICEVRPKYVFVENSPMLTHRGLGTVLGIQPTWGSDAEWGVLGASNIGAKHYLRKRFGLLPDNEKFFHTPTTGSSGGSNSRKAMQKRDVVWPTPTTGTGGGNAGGSGVRRTAKENGTYVPSSINPNLQEWLMG